MQGSPPDAERLVTLANWQEGPYNRWAFQNVGAVVPSAAISRGTGPVLELPVELEELGALPLAEVPDEPTLDQFLRHSYTDAFLVLRDGRISYEAYFNGMTRDSKHLLQSISKSFCGALAGTLVERGVLELDAPTRTYVPELWDSAYGDATVAQLLDMTASVRFSEEYADPVSEVQAQDRAAGWRPRRPDDPETSYAFLRSLRPDGRHGRASSTARRPPTSSRGCSSARRGGGTPNSSPASSGRTSAPSTTLRSRSTPPGSRSRTAACASRRAISRASGS